ncbi:MAG: ABC transporter ATP-binding protein [bacterium]|nr:ABC transporter ATP-binding protein [bacterium]
MDVLNIKNLSKSYHLNGGDVHVVDRLTLSLKKGEVFGFLGPNGAGKTTTIKMIVGLAFPSSGEIKIFGKSNTDLATKEKIGFMSEHPYFYSYLTGREMLDFFGKLFPIAHEVRIKNTKELLEKVGLADAADIPVRKYSKGMNQRLGLASALINDPKIIFLDEPLDGLDPLGRRQIKEIIKDLKKEGKTVFLNSHILADAEEICDQIGIIDRGKLIARGEPKSLVKGSKSLEDFFVKLIEKRRREDK